MRKNMPKYIVTYLFFHLYDQAQNTKDRFQGEASACLCLLFFPLSGVLQKVIDDSLVNTIVSTG